MVLKMPAPIIAAIPKKVKSFTDNTLINSDLLVVSCKSDIFFLRKNVLKFIPTFLNFLIKEMIATAKV